MKTTKPRKQRKRLYQEPLHKRYKRFSAPLSSGLKSSHNLNRVQVRVGDTVRITRGDHKALEGKVIEVKRKENKVFLEGITREKIDGTSVKVAIHPSKVMITRLNLDDKRRKEILKRKGVINQIGSLEDEKTVKEEKLKSRKKKKKMARKTAESGGSRSG